MTSLTLGQQVAAAELARLFDAHSDSVDRSETRAAQRGGVASDEEELRVAVVALGHRLNEEGGFDLMAAFGRQLGELTDNTWPLRLWWDGIGRWQF